MGLLILSFNARLWTRDLSPKSEYFWLKRMRAMNNMIKRLKPDIICFQEMNFPASLFIPWKYKHIGFGPSHRIYVKRGMKTRKHSYRIHTEAVEVLFNGTWWKIVNVHSHWSREIIDKDIQRINGLYQSWGDKHFVACGDFNNFAEDIHGNIVPIIYNEVDTFSNFTKDWSHGVIDHFMTPMTTYKFGVVTEANDIAKEYGVIKMSDHLPIMLMMGD